MKRISRPKRLTSAGIISLLIISGFIFSSCSKGSNDGQYYITCNVNGVKTSFNAIALAHTDTGMGYKAMQVHGLTSLSSTAGSFGFVITNNPTKDPINAGTYTDTQTKFEVLASYADNISSPDDYEAGTSNYSEAVRGNVSLVNHYTVVITSIDNQAVRGTFSGDFYFNGDVKGKKIFISNGEFFVKMQ